MKLLIWLKDEIIRIIPAIIYFCVAFNLIQFTTGLELQAGETRYFSYWSVTITGLICGKILLIVDAFPFLDAFPKKPLIYNIIWKFFIYMIVILLVSFMDVFAHHALRYHSIDMAYWFLQLEIEKPIFWAAQMWLYLVFFIFVVFNQIITAIGYDKVKKMVFG